MSVATWGISDHDALTYRWRIGEPSDLQEEGRVFVAVVHAADGVRWITAAGSRDELMCRLAVYVRDRAADVLSAEEAQCVRALVAEENCAGAVDRYFSGVGARWDEEWLATTVIEME